MKIKYFLNCLILTGSVFLFTLNAYGQKKVTFPSKDGLKITADWYAVSDSAPVILLCHQAGFSRGEYIGTAPELNKLGFNCLAIDQRSGDECNGISNETAAEAKRQKKGQSYADAEQDMVASVEYLFNKYHKNVILIGSSYSASLALKIANENNHVFAAVAFSPGEYFEQKDFVVRHISGLNKPVLITSSKTEAAAVTELVKDVISRIKIQYIPMSMGEHGSKVLWAIQPFNDEYWITLRKFLERVKKIEINNE